MVDLGHVLFGSLFEDVDGGVEELGKCWSKGTNLQLEDE